MKLEKATSRLAFAVAVMAGSAAMATAAARAVTQSEFGAAYKAAVQAEQQAGTLRNQWTPTEAALKAARKAADEKDYDQALALAGRAEALAKASVEQAKEQDRIWHNAVVK